MSQTTKNDPNVPLPDPDLVEQRIHAALDSFRERRAFYIFMGVLLLAAVVGVILLVNRADAADSGQFDLVWARASAVRLQLARDKSAREELALLENALAEVRGDKVEGLALWLLAIYNYAEANTSDKTTFDDAKPFLEKARGYLEELNEEKFDNLLLGKPRWFTASAQAPIDALRAQIDSDIAFRSKHASTQPKPADDIVAVLRTSAGDIHLKFFPELAPKHVANFLTLARTGTYNGTKFHYVGGGSEEPQSVKGGDPYTFFYPKAEQKDHILRWGTGGVGYDLPPEKSRFEVKHVRGIVSSMRRGNQPDWDNGSQFQILLQPDRKIDRIYTPFAVVVEGMNVVEKVAGGKTAAQHEAYRDDSSFASTDHIYLLVEPVEIHKVIVFKDGKALEHKFDLKEGEKTLAGLAGVPATAIPEAKIYGGRELRETSADGEPRRGLDIPFPGDLNLEDEQNPPNKLGGRAEKDK